MTGLANITGSRIFPGPGDLVLRGKGVIFREAGRRLARCLVLLVIIGFSAGVNQPASPGGGMASESVPDSLARARIMFGQSVRQAIPLAEKAVSAARQAGDLPAEGNALILLGDCHLRRRDFSASLDCYRQVRELARRHHDLQLEALSMHRQARVEVYRCQYEKATVFYLEAARLSEEAPDPVLGAVINDYLGIVYYILNDQAKARQLCQEARAVLALQGEPGYRADNLEHLGIILSGGDDWPGALDLFQQAQAIREKAGDRYTLAGTLGNVGLALNNLGRPREALTILQRAWRLIQLQDDPQGAPALRHRIGQVLQKLGRPEEALVHFHEALRLHEATGDKRGAYADALALSRLYRDGRGDPAKALEYLEKYTGLKQEVFNEELARRVASLQAGFDDDRRQREIAVLQRDAAIRELQLEQGSLILKGTLALAALLILFLVFTYLRYRSAARTGKALRAALDHLKTLRGLLPICAQCKKIRDDAGYWHQVEDYVASHSEAEFTHGICPACVGKLYPDLPGLHPENLTGKTESSRPSPG